MITLSFTVKRSLGPLLISLGLALSLSPAQAETQNCTAITTLPAVIAASGVYCLTTNLVTAITVGTAITITASDVVLDLNGHQLLNSATASTRISNGVFASERQNITVKNGTISGFYRGVYLQGAAPYMISQGHVVEDILFESSTYIGILAQGRGMLLRTNQILATGGTTVFGANNSGFGVFVTGPSNRLVKNEIGTVTKSGTGLSYGAYFLSAPGSMGVGNLITLADRGIQFVLSTGKIRDNTTSGVAGPYAGTVTNAGFNF